MLFRSMFVCDETRLRKIDANGIITTVAGDGLGGYSGDGGPAIQAALYATMVAVDFEGNLYISDEKAHVIRKVDASGIITTVVGTGTPGYSGDGGPAVNAEIKWPSGIALDRYGNLYFVDNARIRMVDKNGIISTLAGNGEHLTFGENISALDASFKLP